MEPIAHIDCSWREFVEENSQPNKNYIFRGQSNDFFNNSFKAWKLISSFNRYYTSLNFRFEALLGQQLEENLFRSIYGKYKCIIENDLENSNTLTKLYYLQHYAVPTCLIDFTYNPLIALYFAISNIKGRTALTYDSNGDSFAYPANCYLSVYRINTELLKNKVKIKEVEHLDNSLFMNYNKYAMQFLFGNVFAFLDLNPQTKINNKIENYNLTNQESCFLLFDNPSLEIAGFEDFIEVYFSNNNIILDEPIITIYKIPYNNIYGKRKSIDFESESLFRYLINRKISGRNLFNDFQGIKYDFNHFYQI